MNYDLWYTIHIYVSLTHIEKWKSFCLHFVYISYLIQWFSYIKTRFFQVMRAYGYSIEQILVVDIVPDDSVRRAMNEINAGMLFSEQIDPFSLTLLCYFICIILNTF